MSEIDIIGEPSSAYNLVAMDWLPAGITEAAKLGDVQAKAVMKLLRAHCATRTHNPLAYWAQFIRARESWISARQKGQDCG